MMQSIAYDVAIGKVVLFGGKFASGGNPSNQLWTWDGATWTQAE